MFGSDIQGVFVTRFLTRLLAADEDHLKLAIVHDLKRRRLLPLRAPLVHHTEDPKEKPMRIHVLYLSTISLCLLATFVFAGRGDAPAEGPAAKLQELREARLATAIDFEQRVSVGYDAGIVTLVDKLEAAEFRFEAELEMADLDGRIKLYRSAVERARILEEHAKGMRVAGTSPLHPPIAKLRRLELEIELQKLLIEQADE